FGAAALMIFREWQSASHAKAATAPMNDAERRLLEAQNRRQRRWMIAAAAMSLSVILALTADFIYARVSAAPVQAKPVEAVNNLVRIPVAEVQDGNLHLFSINGDGQAIRFMGIKKPDGYRQEGQNVICRRCASAIYIPSIVQKGGCNPIGVASRVDGDTILIDVSALSKAAEEIPRSA